MVGSSHNGTSDLCGLYRIAFPYDYLQRLSDAYFVAKLSGLFSFDNETKAKDISSTSNQRSCW